MSASTPSLDSLRSLSRERGAADGAAIPLPQRRWRTRVLLPGAILIAVAGLLVYSMRGALTPGQVVAVMPVMVKAVQGESGGGGGGGVTVQATGWVEADPFPLNVPALADGVVKEVLVFEGDQVEAGQVVVRMIDDDAKLAERQTLAMLTIASAKLEAARSEWENPVELQRAVASAAAMLAEAQAMVRRVPMEVAVEEARLAEARDELKRKEELLAGQAVSEGDVARLRLRVLAQEAVVDAARAQLPIAEARLAQRQAEANAAQRRMELRIEQKQAVAEAEAGVALSEAMCEEACLRLERMQVRSPVAGVVMVRLAEPGSRLMSAGRFDDAGYAVRLYDPKRLQVRVDVPLAEASRISVGTEARIVVEVLRDRTFQGRVTRIVNQADIQKNTLQVKVAIEDPAADLKPEMLARVRFMGGGGSAEGSAMRERVFVPREAVSGGEEGEGTAWVVDVGRNVALARNVRLGDREESGWIEVLSGLQAGDRVIVRGGAGLRDGSRIRVSDATNAGSL